MEDTINAKLVKDLLEDKKEDKSGYDDDSENKMDKGVRVLERKVPDYQD